MKQKIGQVTPEERNEIQQLFERRNGLNELAKILTPDNDALYQKLVADLGDTSTRFQQWWDRMAVQGNLLRVVRNLSLGGLGHEDSRRYWRT